MHSARLADVTWKRVPTPVRVWIDAIGVDARILPVGVVSGTWTMEVPADVSVVGWYRFGPSPGAAGSSVLVGHVDSRAQGAGVFFRLSQLAPRDRVVVEFGSGRLEWFEVVARRSYDKSNLPDRVFARTGGPVLTLITCGGSFDYRTHHYADNVVVFAVPID